MKPSDDLFQLIRSMSKSERGYFIKYSKVHVKGEQNNYLRLFEVMSDMKEYSDEYLKKKLRFDPVINYLSTAKNQLHGIILKTMRPYYEEYSTYARLGDMNNDVEFLHSKSLKGQSVKLNNRLKQGSITNEKPLLLIEALNRDYKLLIAEMENAGERDITLEKTWSEQKKAMKILGNTLELEYLNQKILSFSNKTGYIRCEKDQALLDEIIKESALEDVKSCLSSDAETNWYLVKARGKMMMGNHEKALKLLNKLLALFDAQATLTRNHPGRFVSLLNDLVLTGVKSGKFKEASGFNSRLKRLQDFHSQFRTDYFKSRIFISSLSNDLLLFQNTGEYTKATDQIEFLENEIKQHLPALDASSRITFILRCSISYFSKGEFRKALQHLQEIICYGYEKHNADFDNFIRVYNLLIHFELENKDHLFYAIKSASRGFIRKDRMFTFEKVMLSFLRNSINKGRKMQSKEDVLRQLCSELRIIKEDQYGARSFEHFDFLDWAVKKYSETDREAGKEKTIKRKISKKEFIYSAFH